MIIIVVIVLVLVLVSSSGVAVFGYFSGWFGPNSAAAAEAAAAAASASAAAAANAANASSANAGAGTGATTTSNFTGLSTACALSYKPSQDVYNAAIPPFDPNACQGVQMEANCESWLSVQQGTQWMWQKTGVLDGCVPVAPQPTLLAGQQASASASASGPASAGNPGGGIVINQTGGGASGLASVPVASVPADSAKMANAQAGGYGKYGRWRNVADTKKIIALANRSATKRAAAVPVNKSKTVGAPPAPYAQPKFSDHAPYFPGMIKYPMM